MELPITVELMIIMIAIVVIIVIVGNIIIFARIIKDFFERK